MKKLCTKKCKPCKGNKCLNFYGSAEDLDFGRYYECVLHGRKVSFGGLEKSTMTCGGSSLVCFLIALTLVLTLTGGLLC